MADPAEPRFRTAVHGDAEAIAALHANSWRRHYRGAYSDAFLDGEAAGYLLALWTERFAAPDGHSRTIVAVSDDVIVGIAHTIFDRDPSWGSLLENLHVTFGLQRRGIGRRLLARSGQAAVGWSPSSGLYLWALEHNSPARAFYGAMGGACADRRDVPRPGGDPANLNGRPACLRYAWRDPASLFRAGL